MAWQRRTRSTGSSSPQPTHPYVRHGSSWNAGAAEDPLAEQGTDHGSDPAQRRVREAHHTTGKLRTLLCAKLKGLLWNTHTVYKKKF